jgi:preprotein translocase subunit SecG
MFVYILIIVVAALLALVVLAQNPKGGGLAAGFTGAQQIGGVQRTADFLEKSTWTLAAALMILCLVNANPRSGAAATGDGPGDAPIQVDEAAPTAPPADGGAEETNP